MRILLTGGSACGKSTYAEKLAVSLPGPRYYLATMRPYGEESLKKIARHRTMRAEKGFDTIEKYTALGDLHLPARGTILLECLCNLTANEMFDINGICLRNPVEQIYQDLLGLEAQCRDLIVVTNDVGSDGDAAYSESTLLYRKALGQLNCLLADRYDTVYELVCGIPILRKGEPIR